MEGDLRRISRALKLVAESLDDVAKLPGLDVPVSSSSEAIVEAIYLLFATRPPGPLPTWFEELERQVVRRLAQDGRTARELAPFLGLKYDAARQYLCRRGIRLSEL